MSLSERAKVDNAERVAGMIAELLDSESQRSPAMYYRHCMRIFKSLKRGYVQVTQILTEGMRAK